MILKDNSLPTETLNIIRHKFTEKPHTGLYNTSDLPGTYLCRACGVALFRAHAKFSASCGWPSFDAAIEHAVIEEMDADGSRTEILCARCHGHLGHVFNGEGFTPKNRRFCVNAQSLDFVENTTIMDTEEAILAAGCFWGVQYYLDRLPGVLKTEVGYTGGKKQLPTYQDVCEGTTGHLEAIRVLYNPTELTYEAVLKYFFEIHDPTQHNGQGPDHGEQYQSAIFYYDHQQKQTATHLIELLHKQGHLVATQLQPVSAFWLAETDHQHYYEKTQHTPYCHTYTKRFT